MPIISFTEAAKIAKVSVSTITRAIHSGRLSATVTQNGRKGVDPSELDRVFPSNAPRMITQKPIGGGAQDAKEELRDAQNHRIEELLHTIRSLENDKDDLRKRLDRSEQDRSLALRLLEDKRGMTEPATQKTASPQASRLQDKAPTKAKDKGGGKTPQKTAQRGKKKK